VTWCFTQVNGALGKRRPVHGEAKDDTRRVQEARYKELFSSHDACSRHLQLMLCLQSSCEYSKRMSNCTAMINL
jgi:hypothetical protein